METELTLSDDSGLFGLVDAASYSTFVDEDWTYEQLLGHSAHQMQRNALLVWDCADGGNNYRVRVRDRITTESGHREVFGQIVAIGGNLHLASYTALTMAAQFPECGIPDKSEQHLVIPVTPGTYKVRIAQKYDPEAAQSDDSGEVLVELEPGEAPNWTCVAWHSV